MIDLNFNFDLNDIKRYIENPKFVQQQVALNVSATPPSVDQISLFDEYRNQAIYLIGAFITGGFDGHHPQPTNQPAYVQITANKQRVTPAITSNHVGVETPFLVFFPFVNGASATEYPHIPLKLQILQPIRAGSRIELQVSKADQIETVIVIASILAAVGKTTGVL